MSNQTDLTDYALTQKPDINHQDKSGNTALHYAIWRKDKNLIKKLIQQNADIHIFNLSKETPLYLAMMSKDPETISLINPEKKPFPQHVETIYKQQLPSLEYDPKHFERYLDLGLDPTFIGEDQYSYFHLAIARQKIELVKAMLDMNVNPELKTKSGKTPLSLAVEAKDIELVKLLVSAGANPNILQGPHNKYVSAIQTAISMELWQIVEFLLQHQADYLVINQDQKNIFHLAVDDDNLRILEKSVELNLKLDFVDELGHGILYYALKKQRFKLAQWFLNHLPKSLIKQDVIEYVRTYPEVLSIDYSTFMYLFRRDYLE